LRAVWSDNEGLRRRNNLSIPQVWPAPTDWSTRNVSSGCLPTLTPSTMGSGLVLCITSRSPFGSISADRAGARRGPRRLRCQVLAISVQRSAWGRTFPVINRWTRHPRRLPSRRCSAGRCVQSDSPAGRESRCCRPVAALPRRSRSLFENRSHEGPDCPTPQSHAMVWNGPCSIALSFGVPGRWPRGVARRNRFRPWNSEGRA
jgi:hypothetical protein